MAPYRLASVRTRFDEICGLVRGVLLEILPHDVCIHDMGSMVSVLLSKHFSTCWLQGRVRPDLGADKRTGNPGT